MTWTNYWTQRGYQPKSANNLKYQAWLEDKNLAPSTIRSYLDTLAKFNPPFTTQAIKEYFLKNQRKYQASTLKLHQYALNSYLKFQQLKVE